MKHNLFILFTVIAFILSSCEKDEMTLNGRVDTSKVSIVASYRTADVQWKITCNADIDDVWAEYASDSTFADYEQKKMTMVNAKENDGQYKVSLTSLKDGQTYYLRCRVSNRYSSCTSEPRTFQTKAYHKPEVQMDSITNITYTSAMLHATLLDWGMDTIPQVGFCYAKHADVKISDRCVVCKISGTQEKISYSASLKDLEDGGTYYVRAYAKNSKGVGYGKEIQFTTQEILLPSVDKIEVTDKSYSYAICRSSVLSDGGQEVTERGICYALTLNPTISDNVVKAGSGTGAFSCTLSNLVGGTTYYARAYATNNKGTAYSPFSQAITTTSYSAPTVTYTSTSNITSTSATCKGNVTASGGLTVISRGVCYSPTSTPTISDSTVTSGTGTGSFTCSLTGLTPGTKYYVRSFAINSEGTSYSDQVTFTTTATTPTVTTSTATSITTTTASCGGNVTSDGGASVTSRGVCYSTSSNPTISNSKVISGSGIGSYTCSLTGLTPGTKYYVRAYATNSAGTSYGSEVTFTTTATKPKVTTLTATSITATTASCGGNVISDGGLTVTARGVCYSTSSNPTISNSKVTSGSGTGLFTCNLTGLSASTTYYVRAYATNSKGTSYGSQITFTTPTKPTVTTSTPTSITATTASCGGNVTSDGGASVTSRGVCYSTTSSPTISNRKVTNGTGTGSFTCNLTGLTAGTTYYARAFATNSEGTSYGSQVTFTTTTTTPTVTTSSASSVTETTAICGGNVTTSGGLTVTERGVCYSTSSTPTISNSKVTSGTGTGSFTCNLTGLTAGTKYYVRAYATNSKGTSYGSEVTFTTTATKPTVTTSTATSITATTASCGGNVTSDGGASVTSRGVCYATTSSPTTSNSKVTSGTGTGSFTCSVTGLTAGTKYYVRAYATNSKGTSYGNEISFTTNTDKPTVTTTSPTGISYTTATCGGNVTSSGGLTVTARGVCYSTSSSPTISNSKVTSGTGTGSFTCSLTGLTAGTKYYVRAFATNSKGTSYGTSKTFTTTAYTYAPTVTTSSATNVTYATATCGGNVTSDGGLTVTARGVCYSTSTLPTISDSKVTSGSGTGSFTCSLTGLSASTTYYVRAYATNSKGTSYGSQISFTTTAYNANAVLVYYAGAKLSETTTLTASGLHTNAFGNVSIVSHTFDSNFAIPRGEIVFSGNLTTIGENAFYYCTDLIQVNIPSTVTNIGDRAFNGCSNIIYVSIPANVQTTGKFPFTNCSSLTTVVWNATNCTTYDNGQYVYPPFQDCTNITSFTISSNVCSLPRGLCYGLPITSIVIPAQVTSIGVSAFRECTSLTSITCKATTPPSCGTDAFRDVPKSIPVKVPSSSISKYKVATGWSDFTNIQAY